MLRLRPRFTRSRAFDVAFLVNYAPASLIIVSHSVTLICIRILT